MPQIKILRDLLSIVLLLFVLTGKSFAIIPKGEMNLIEVVMPAEVGIQNQDLYDRYPYSMMYYYGITARDPLLRMLFTFEFHRWPEHIQSLEFDYTLAHENPLRRLVKPLVGVVQFAANITMRIGSRQDTIYEFDPYFAFRWANFPWNKYLNTSLAIGEGISYATAVPAFEKKRNKEAKRLLNYLMLEATFGSPYHPRLQLLVRVHHRSGAYGLYDAGNTGSNDIGLGLRYLFD